MDSQRTISNIASSLSGRAFLDRLASELLLQYSNRSGGSIRLEPHITFRPGPAETITKGRDDSGWVSFSMSRLGVPAQQFAMPGMQRGEDLCEAHAWVPRKRRAVGFDANHAVDVTGDGWPRDAGSGGTLAAYSSVSNHFEDLRSGPTWDIAPVGCDEAAQLPVVICAGQGLQLPSCMRSDRTAASAPYHGWRMAPAGCDAGRKCEDMFGPLPIRDAKDGRCVNGSAAAAPETPSAVRSEVNVSIYFEEGPGQEGPGAPIPCSTAISEETPAPSKMLEESSWLMPPPAWWSEDIEGAGGGCLGSAFPEDDEVWQASLGCRDEFMGVELVKDGDGPVVLGFLV